MTNLYVESKTKQNEKNLSLQIQREVWLLPGVGDGWVTMEVGQEVQTSSYKLSQSWGCYVQHGDYG